MHPRHPLKQQQGPQQRLPQAHLHLQLPSQRYALLISPQHSLLQLLFLLACNLTAASPDTLVWSYRRPGLALLTIHVFYPLPPPYAAR